jgi:hypothetical protein
MRKKRFDEILIGNDDRFLPPRIKKVLRNRYGPAARVFRRGQERRFLPLSGFAAHPRQLLVPGEGSGDPPVWVGGQK